VGFLRSRKASRSRLLQPETSNPIVAPLTQIILLTFGPRAVIGEEFAHLDTDGVVIFGSVARGDATSESDIDIIVELLPGGANPLMRLAGLSEEFRLILGRDVDVVAVDLLKAPVAKTALDHPTAI